MHDLPFFASLTIPSRVESIRPAAAFVTCAARALGVPAASEPLFEVAIVEALNNAVKHGSPDSDDSILCELERSGSRLLVRVLGKTAIPAAVAMPSSTVSRPALSADEWETIPENGYGLHLIAAVFPSLRPVSRGARHGLEMELSC